MLQVWASLGAGLDPKMLCAASLVCFVGLFLTMTLLGRAFANTNFQAAFVALSAISGGAVIWAAHFVAMTAYHPQLQSGYDPVRTTFAFMTALAGMTASFWAAVTPMPNRPPARAGLQALRLAAAAQKLAVIPARAVMKAKVVRTGS